MEAWARGNLAASFEMEHIVKNAGAAAACEMLREIQELTYNDLLTELRNEQ